MTRPMLAAWLRSIANAVETGDSAEGHIQWLLPEDPNQNDEVVVEAAVRVGNLEGQGGYKIIDERTDDREHDVLTEAIKRVQDHGKLIVGLYPAMYDFAIADVVKILEAIRA